MGLYIGYETVEPWLTRTDIPDEKARAAGLPPKCVLRADPDAGRIVIDTETTLAGIPPAAFAYRLGNRSALDWVLDQHKEKKPKDPTIRALQHLPLRRPQGARHRPAGPRHPRQRRNPAHHRRNENRHPLTGSDPEA